MRRNKSLSLIIMALMFSTILGLGTLTTPVAAGTTTYNGSGNNRTILEQANKASSGFINQNQSALDVSLPGGGWSGYQLGTTFTNIAANADYVTNGGFDTNTVWIYSESGDTGYLSGDWTPSPPSGTTTGSDYIRLMGKTTVLTATSSPSTILNPNFTSSASWTPSNSYTGYITPTSVWDSTAQEWEEKGTYYNPSYSYYRSGSANIYCDQSFNYNGQTPPDFASLSYKFYIKDFQTSGGSVTIRVRLILTPPSPGTDQTILDYTATGTSSKPLNPTTVDLTSYLSATGSYRVRLWAYITLYTPPRQTTTATVRWDDVGVYIRYGKFIPSMASWSELVTPFGQPVVSAGMLTFRYRTDLTYIVPPADSYLSAWVIGTSSYASNIIAFSSITAGSWQTAAVSVPLSYFNNSAQITVKIGITIGSNLLIQTSVNPYFYFDNVTFWIKYKPTPQSVNLRIYDVTYSQTYVVTGTSGQGALTITPTSPWSTSPAQFKFMFSASNVEFGYSSTMYAGNLALTDSATFQVSDDTRSFWYCTYDTPDSIGGYVNYNVTIYVPADWLQSGLVDWIKFGGIAVTNYVTTSVNSSTSLIKISANAFPTPPMFLLEVHAISPNYLGPAQMRTLLFTQGNATNIPGPNDWRNSTSFVPQNMTRLVTKIRAGDGAVPSGVDLFAARIQLYNDSSGTQYTGLSWSIFPDLTGTCSVTLSPWSYYNVTWFDGAKDRATSWFFNITWTSGYEAANAIARFTTNTTASPLIPMDLTAPKSPYTAPWGDGFTLEVRCTNTRNGSGVQGATVKWRWINQVNQSQPMLMTPGIRGNYTAPVYNFDPAQHFGSTYIEVNASLSGFVFSSIQVRVIVRDILTTGDSSYFSVPYTTYPWNKTLGPITLTFRDVDHNNQGILGATLFMNQTYANSTTVGSSGIKWWYVETGGGIYNLFFSTTATPTGTSTWTFTVSANKSHYVQRGYGLNGFNVRDRLTSHSQPSTSVTTPWGDSATFLITYRDDDTGTAVWGATPTCTWGQSYICDPLPNGTYRFQLNVAGLAPSTYPFSFSFSKNHWVPITFSAQVVIRNISTGIVAPALISVYWQDNKTVTIAYKDFDHSLNMSSANWNIAHAINKLTLVDYSLTYNIKWNSTSNSWYLRLNGSLPVGDYTLWLRASAISGYYDVGWSNPTLSIMAIATSLELQATTLTVPWSDSGRIVVRYVDTIHGNRPILGASVAVVVETSITPFSFANGSGIYTVFLNTVNGTEFYPYGLTIQVSKDNYTYAEISGVLLIRPVYARIDVTLPSAVTKGTPAVYIVRLTDTDHNLPITNATITLDGVDPSHYTVEDLHNGDYRMTLQTDWIQQDRDFTIRAVKTHYADQTAVVTFRFPTTISPMMIIMIGGGSSGAVILAALGLILYRRSKIPFVIKKIDQSIKLITKGEMVQPVPMRTRSELIGSIFQTKTAILTKEAQELERKKKGQKGIKPEGEGKEVPPAGEVEVVASETGVTEEVEKKPSPVGSKGTEASAAGEVEGGQVDAIIGELEKLGRGEEEKPSEEAELVKREIDELGKEMKREKKKKDD